MNSRISLIDLSSSQRATANDFCIDRAGRDLAPITIDAVIVVDVSTIVARGIVATTAESFSTHNTKAYVIHLFDLTVTPDNAAIILVAALQTLNPHYMCHR
jgi:hypothetical protein